MNFHKDTSPGLETPYENMLAFLLRSTSGCELQFSRSLRFIETYDELHVVDQIEFCRLLTEHRYFDVPNGEPVSMEELISSIKEMIEGEGGQ